MKLFLSLFLMVVIYFFNIDAYPPVDRGTAELIEAGILTTTPVPDLNDGSFYYNKFDQMVYKKDDPFHPSTTTTQTPKIFYEWQKIAQNGLTLVPPKELPNLEAFLLNNYSTLKSIYLNDVPHNEKISITIWNKTYIEALVKSVKQNPYSIFRSYENQSLSVFMATKYFNVSGQVGAAVIGSRSPMTEAYILANGAKYVTTIDYQKIIITHHQMIFDDYAPELLTLQKNLSSHFDFIVSFSIIEHTGLGRYDDPTMDPNGDIREMNKIRCLLKNGGLLFVGFPVGMDTVYFNASRVYGRIRLAMMFEGFRLLGVFFNDSNKPIKLTQKILENEGGSDEYLFVLQKKD